MKKILFILICIFVYASLLRATDKSSYRIYDAKKSKYIELSDIVTDFKKADILFFGEIHDDSLMHYLEFELLKSSKKGIKNLAVSMEMFERDSQPTIELYFGDKIKEDIFIKESRAWGNYVTDYKPIVEFCKTNRVPLIASNVPRRIASLVNRKGLIALDSLSEQDRSYTAKSIKIAEGEYKRRFMELMNSGMSMTPNHIKPSNKMMENLFLAQCIKDDTMAESINNYLSANAGYKIIHYNGEFHSDYKLGTVERIKSDYKVLTITSIIKGNNEKLEINKEDDIKKADYLIIKYRTENK